MIITEKIPFPAYTGTEERRLYVYLPVGYDDEPDRHYPVIYMFDGHNVFFDTDATYGKSWGLGEYLDYTEAPVIVAALECHHGSGNERLCEYSPYSFSKLGFGNVIGKGDQTMRFFTGELKPYIDKLFRTIPDRDHTFIMGSSMGGLMSLYAIFKYNRFFSKCAALSPTIYPCYNELTDLINKTRLNKNTTIYMDMGSEEMTFEGGSAFKYSNFGSLMIKKKIALTQRVILGGQHCEASWEKQLPIIMNVLLYE